METITTTLNYNDDLRLRRCWAFPISLPFVDCEAPESPAYEVDCNCLNNEPFFFPVKETDIWDFQTFLVDELNTPENIFVGWNDGIGNWVYELQVVNCSGEVLDGQVDQFADDWLVGYSGTGFIQNVRVNFSLFWEDLEDIFCLRVARYDAGQQLIDYVYFPPMRKDRCGSKTTTELSSTLSTYDCMGRWYGVPEIYYGSSAFAFNNWRRIYANLETVGFPITSEETDKGVVISKTVEKEARLRSWGLPEYVVEELAAIFAGDDISIAGEFWDVIPNLEKNNDVSQMWYLDALITRVKCEFTRDCE